MRLGSGKYNAMFRLTTHISLEPAECHRAGDSLRPSTVTHPQYESPSYPAVYSCSMRAIHHTAVDTREWRESQSDNLVYLSES